MWGLWGDFLKGSLNHYSSSLLFSLFHLFLLCKPCTLKLAFANLSESLYLPPTYIYPRPGPTLNQHLQYLSTPYKTFDNHPQSRTTLLIPNSRYLLSTWTPSIMTTEWSLDYCLVCDRQTLGGPYCTQACRLAELDHVASEALRTSTTKGATTHSCQPGASAHSSRSMTRVLSPSSSHTSLSSLQSNSSLNSTVSDRFQSELRDYASSFDQIRDLKRRMTSWYDSMSWLPSTYFTYYLHHWLANCASSKHLPYMHFYFDYMLYLYIPCHEKRLLSLSLPASIPFGYTCVEVFGQQYTHHDWCIGLCLVTLSLLFVEFTTWLLVFINN